MPVAELEWVRLTKLLELPADLMCWPETLDAPEDKGAEATIAEALGTELLTDSVAVELDEEVGEEVVEPWESSEPEPSSESSQSSSLSSEPESAESDPSSSSQSSLPSSELAEPLELVEPVLPPFPSLPEPPFDTPPLPWLFDEWPLE